MDNYPVFSVYRRERMKSQQKDAMQSSVLGATVRDKSSDLRSESSVRSGYWSLQYMMLGESDTYSHWLSRVGVAEA